MRRTITALLLTFALLSALERPAFAFVAPVAASFATAVPVTAQSVIQLQGSDADGTPLTYATTGGPSHGALSNLNTATGAVVYTPTAGYTGPDSFTYTVTSGGATSAAGTVSITVTAAKTRVVHSFTYPDGSPMQGKVSFFLTQVASSPSGTIPAKASVSCQLNSVGQCDVSLYPSRAVSPVQYYQAWFDDSTTRSTQMLGIYEIPAATATISLAGRRVTDANLTAQYVFATKAEVDAMTAAVAAATTAQLYPQLAAGRHVLWNGTTFANSIVSETGTTVTIAGAVNATGGYGGILAANVPPIDASKIASGTLPDSRIASAAAWNAKVATFNGRTGAVTLQSDDLNGLNAAGMVGIAGGTGGVENSGATTIGADIDADGVGVVGLQTRLTTRLLVNNDGTVDLLGGLAGFTRSALPTPGAPGRRLRVTDECNREVVDTGRDWANVSDVINVQQCGASGARLSTGIETPTTTTSGATSSGATTLAVASGSSFDNGETIKVTGAGPSGAVYRGVITAGGGTTSWTVYPAINTAVSSGATVTHGDNNVTTLVTGSASAGATSVTVADPATFKAGHGLYVAGGGAASGGGKLPHIATITSVSSNTITFTPALVTGVSAGALVMHDDTAAIRAALSLASARRALTVYFPAGTYMVNRPDLTGVGGNAGTFLLPEVPCCGDQTVGLDLAGDARPPALQPSFLNHEVSTAGSIIQSDQAGGALFTAKTPVSGNSYGFSMINLRIRHLHFRLYDNPQKRGLDLAWINIAHLDSFGVDTGTPTNRVTQPTNSNAVGLYMPGPLNSAGVARDGYIYGFYKGMVTGEHGDISDVLTQLNLVGYEFPAADYPITIGALVSNQNTSHYKITGAVQFAGEGHIKAERRWSSSIAPVWTTSTYDLEDPSNLGRGKLSIFSWDPGTGVSQVPILNGANNMRVRPVASAAEVGEGQGFGDTFGAATLDTSRWGVGSAFFAGDGSASGTVSQTGGLLQISPEASVSGGRYRGVVTQQYFNFLTGKTAKVKVPQVATNGAETVLIVAQDTNHWYGITQTGTSLIFSGKSLGSPFILATVTYNAVTHLWWRLRFAAGVMYAETSPDNSTWTTIGSAGGGTALFAPSRVRVSLEAGVGSSIASPGTAQFDDFTISAP